MSKSAISRRFVRHTVACASMMGCWWSLTAPRRCQRRCGKCSAPRH
jgi:hypothetical protein